MKEGVSHYNSFQRGELNSLALTNEYHQKLI